MCKRQLARQRLSAIVLKRAGVTLRLELVLHLPASTDGLLFRDLYPFTGKLFRDAFLYRLRDLLLLFARDRFEFRSSPIVDFCCAARACFSVANVCA